MEPRQYDVIVLGGAFSGAAVANLLLRQKKDRRVLIIESKIEFDCKVGEATVEMSGLFLHRRLGLWDYMSRHQLYKQGLRYWFHNEKTEDLLGSAETGPFVSVSVPSFQLNRATMDEKLLSLAVEAGAELVRPARVVKVELKDYDNLVTYSQDGMEKQARAPWVLDATGKATLLGRQLGITAANAEHPTAALWARFEGVLDMDANLYPRNKYWNQTVVTSRRNATNHFCGFGYWIWAIPLHNGTTSVGVVYDKRLIKLADGPREAALMKFFNGIPGLKQIMMNARVYEGDLKNYDSLPYVASKYMGRGWALVGDAAAFMDPYYSPGLDHCSISAEATSRLVGRQLDGRLSGEVIDNLISTHNDRFTRSYDWFFQTVYKDKYFYMGESDLLSAAFMIDTSFYYIYLVKPTFRDPRQYSNLPPYHAKAARPFFLFHRFLNRRLKKIAVNRIRAGRAGRLNDGRRIGVNYALGWRAEENLYRGLKLWAKAELNNLWIAPLGWRNRNAGLADLARMAACTGSRPETMPAPAPAMTEKLPA